MDAKREQAAVGLFVLVASGLLIFAVFFLSGALAGKGKTLHAFYANAAGVKPGGTVTFSGVEAGRITKVRVVPDHIPAVEVTFTVDESTPVRTGSVAAIVSPNPLGDSHIDLSVGPGELLPDGSEVKAEEFVSFSTIISKMNALMPEAQKLLQGLDLAVGDVRLALSNVNELLGTQNRDNISASLQDVRGMLDENRPKIRASLTNVEASTEKLKVLLDDFRGTAKRADEALQQVNDVLAENRPEIRQAIVELRKTLEESQKMVAQLSNMMVVNADNIDEIMDNVRITTENLKQFTDTIKQRPSTLLRSSTPADRKPGEAPKQK